MRDLHRNRQDFYYAALSSCTDIVDEYGNLTGGKSYTYLAPVKFSANISPEKGRYSRDEQGITNTTVRTITTTDLDCPIQADYAIWIGISTEARHNFIVESVEKSLNSITISVRRVSVG